MAGVLVAVAAGVGVPQPLRDRLGLGGGPGGTAPCEPDPRLVRAPAQPASSPAGRWLVESPLPRRRDEAKAIGRGSEIWIVGGAVPAADGVGSAGAALAFDPARGRYRSVPRLPEPLDHVASGAYRGDVV